MPTIKAVYENQGHIYSRIVVPITDGKKVYQLPCDLKEAYDTECNSVVKQFEKFIMLRIIDDAWKENLRQLDELKHSVQNSSYEQKDPLLIFKLERKRFILPATESALSPCKMSLLPSIIIILS